MKRCLLTVLLLCLWGCGGEEKGEPAAQIALQTRLIVVNSDATPRRSNILSGNGGYRIVYPKRVTTGTNTTEAYSEDFFRLRVENDRTVVVESTLSGSEWIRGFFLVVDRLGEKRLFVVDSSETVGLLDFGALESTLFSDSDYWQK